MKNLLTIVAVMLCVTAYAQKPNIDKAIAALDKGKLEEAKMIIDQAIDYQKAKDYEYYYSKGVASYKSEDFESAANNFEKAYSIRPADGLSMLNAAYASLRLEDHDRAKMNFEKASENGITNLSIFLKPSNCKKLTPIGITVRDSEITLSAVPKRIPSSAQSLR